VHYNRLTREQRSQIFLLKSRKESNRSIAISIKVSPSTIGRELQRNTRPGKSYDWQEADLLASQRKSATSSKPTKMTPFLVKKIKKLIRQYHAPDQISGDLKLQGISISIQTIYTFIEKDRLNGGRLYKYLRNGGKKQRKKRHPVGSVGLIKNRVDISQRPAIVDTKSRIGDLEVDLIEGLYHSGYIISIVDRHSKAVYLAFSPTKEPGRIAAQIILRLKRVESICMPLTITSDNGLEFAFHEAISKAFNCGYFFARPYHSWERGLNEFSNRLVRQFFPKRSSFAGITKERLIQVEMLLNNRPRKVLGYRTPNQVLFSTRPVALHI